MKLDSRAYAVIALWVCYFLLIVPTFLNQVGKYSNVRDVPFTLTLNDALIKIFITGILMIVLDLLFYFEDIVERLEKKKMDK